MAGGSGTRMNSEVPKQFLRIGGVPIIIKTILRFTETVPDIEVIVVLPQSSIDHWEQLAAEFDIANKFKTAIGGNSRTKSVMAGLQVINETGLVAIHDAVRPFVESTTISSSFDAAEKYGSGVAAVPLKDSIRKIEDGGTSSSRDRSRYVAVQTPQTFQITYIKEAYHSLEEGDEFTDDATVLERYGYKVHLVDGTYSNLKITTPEDLKSHS